MAVLALGALGAIYAFAAGLLKPDWRGAAAALAVVLPLAALLRIVMSRQLTVLVLAMQLLFVPELALIAFAAGTGQVPQMRVWFPLAVFVIFCELLFTVLVFMNYRLGSNLKTVTFAMSDRVDDRALLARTLTVLALSAILFAFDPWFGVLNLVANGAWICLWIPRRWRTVEYEMGTVEISGSVDHVFAFATDPANWSQYRSDVEVENVEPPGRLAAGTRYTLRRRLPVMRGGRKLELVTNYVVTDLVPAQRYSVKVPERPMELAITEFEGDESTARIRFHGYAVLRLSQAIAGVMLNLSRDLASRRAADLKTYGRMKELLEVSGRPA